MSAIKVTFNKPLARKILASFARAFIGVFVAGVSGLLGAIYGSTTGAAGGTLDWSAGKAALVALVIAAIAAALRTLQHYLLDGSVFKLVSVKGLNQQIINIAVEITKDAIDAVKKSQPAPTDTAPVTPQTEEKTIEQVLAEVTNEDAVQAVEQLKAKVDEWHGLESQRPKDQS